ncbi:MAG: hypothetical protein CVV06_00400 [Gammaproteobacteria bacterium HGW-Gammaproteobacteria-10]|nr:MAG: hypothetical protein CVV06_00400 [Gammaproteobacteria bacterium HGW-Gammaproteobacteria-10]
MKKIYQVAAAASLALIAGNASATLVDGRTTGLPSSVVLGVVDRDTSSASFGYTFVYDTGFKYSDFVNGNGLGAQSWDLSLVPEFAGFLGSSNLQYSIVGSYALNTTAAVRNLGKERTDFADPIETQWGALSLSLSEGDFNNNNRTQLLNATGSAQTTLVGAIPKWINLINLVDWNNEIGSPNAGAIKPEGENVFFDDNFSIGELTLFANQVFALNETANFWWVTNPNQLSTVPGTQTFLGSFVLDSSYQLNFTPVPVPAAVWLFGSALVGLMGARSRNVKLVEAA